MKTSGRGNPNRLGYTAQQPSSWRGRSKQILLDRVGWEARKTLAGAIVFFLDFPFYRTFQDLAMRISDNREANLISRANAFLMCLLSIV